MSNRVVKRVRDQEKIQAPIHRLRFHFLIAIAGLFLYIPNLGGASLRVWDESIYANAARHMVADGHWLIPHMYWSPTSLAPFLQKPPLVMWFEALSMSVFGWTAFAARLPVALAAISLGLVTFSIGRDWFDWKTGLTASFILLVMPGVYSWGHSGRSAALDVPLVLFGTLFVWWTLRARDDPRLFIPAGVAAAAAVLSKGIAAGVFLVILAPLVVSNWRDYLSIAALKGSVVASILILPWPIYAWSQYPTMFMDEMVLRQARRSAGELQSYGDPVFQFMNFPYIDFVFTSKAYAPFVFISILTVGWLARKSKEQRKLLFLGWWAAAVVLTFSVVGGNHSWYILPAVVPLSLLCGRGVREIASVWNEKQAGMDSRLLITDLRYVIVAICVLGIVAGVYPAFDTPPAMDSGQEELGKSFSEIPQDSTIYLESGTLDPRHYPFAFYANRPIDELERGRLETDPDVRYAVVSTDTLDSLSRGYVKLESADGSVAIRLRPPK